MANKAFSTRIYKTQIVRIMTYKWGEYSSGKKREKVVVEDPRYRERAFTVLLSLSFFPPRHTQRVCITAYNVTHKRPTKATEEPGIPSIAVLHSLSRLSLLLFFFFLLSLFFAYILISFLGRTTHTTRSRSSCGQDTVNAIVPRLCWCIVRASWINCRRTADTHTTTQQALCQSRVQCEFSFFSFFFILLL